MSTVSVVCSDCGVKYECPKSTYDAIKREGRAFRCHSCAAKYRKEFMTRNNKNRTPEQKKVYYAKVSAKQKKNLAEMDPDSKAARMARVNKGRDQWKENVTQEEKERISQAHSEANKERWANMTDEEYEAACQKLRESWQNKSDEEKAAHAERTRLMWATEDPDKRREHVRKIVAHGKNPEGNDLERKFAKTFRHSHLANDFYIVPQYCPSGTEVDHVWDFAIFNKDNQLVSLVDTDGGRYHADGDKPSEDPNKKQLRIDEDYSGTSSKEENDEKRSLSAPQGVSIFIIRAGFFKDDFTQILKSIYIGYDEYIENIFNVMSNKPFPEPNFTADVLIQSYKNLLSMDPNHENYQNLSVNNRYGDILIQQYHRNIYHSHLKGSPSPYDAWHDKTLLRKCIENRTIYQTYLTDRKLLQGFNVSKIAPKVSVFSAGRAKLIISRYLSEFDTIFDPFSGFSGRMLGAISLGKKYIGQDINEINVRESNQMIDFLSQYFNFDATVTQQDILPSSGSYPCLFTCPPYSDKEQWNGTPVDKRSCDDWIDICLERFKCKRYVFVVDNTTRYAQYVVDEITNKSHFGIKSEKLIVIDK